MLGLSETALLGFTSIFVGLVTAGLVPYMISKNTQQHLQGTEDRKNQKEQLDKLLRGQTRIYKDVATVKKDVRAVQEQRNLDKAEFLKLYERVITSDAEAQRGNGIIDPYGDSSAPRRNNNPVVTLPSAELDQSDSGL